MPVVTNLEQCSKAELVSLIYELQRENAALQHEVQRLTERLHPPKHPPSRLANLLHRLKRPGQKPGHTGLTRATPTHIDRVVEQRLTRCPQCRGPLGTSVAVTTHLQEDLIPAQVAVTCFQRHRYYCRRCRQVVTAPAAPEEIPQSHLGPQVLTHALLLKYVHGLPFNKIRTAFQPFANLTVSEGRWPKPCSASPRGCRSRPPLSATPSRRVPPPMSTRPAGSSPASTTGSGRS